MSVPPPPLLEEAEAEAENSNDEAKAPGEAMKEEEDSSDNEADAGWIEGKSGLDFKIMCLIWFWEMSMTCDNDGHLVSSLVLVHWIWFMIHDNDWVL